jgi:hypothetical protein
MSKTCEKKFIGDFEFKTTDIKSQDANGTVYRGYHKIVISSTFSFY